MKVLHSFGDSKLFPLVKIPLSTLKPRASSSMGPYAHSDNFFDAQTTESHDVQDDIAEEAEVGRSPTTDVAVSLDCKVSVMLN